jgi:hypothetical protein
MHENRSMTLEEKNNRSIYFVRKEQGCKPKIPPGTVLMTHVAI